MRAPQPSNETARLNVLQRYEILDTSAEKVFDDLARLAAHICRTPTALISLIDTDRQWFKSKVGLEASETSRDVSLCAHAILQSDVFIIQDTHQDVRFVDNPLVTAGPGIRFYAGAPLITGENLALGTLCIIDYVPRDLSPEQQEALQILAHQVMTQLELRHSLAALNEAIIQCQQSEEALVRAEAAVVAKLELEKEITERKRAEVALSSSIATNRALLNAIPDSMFRISKDGTLVNFKAANDNNLLVPLSGILGKKLNEVLPPDAALLGMNCMERALSTGDIQIFEYQLLLNNSRYDYEARIVVSAKDEVMAIVRDISDRKRAEEDIRNALKKEKELSELKSRFITMTSHEFRTPLTTILSSAELLQDYSTRWSEEKKLQHLHRIIKAVKHMTQLLNDVLLIGKAEAGKLECNPVPLDVVQFCRDLVDEIQLGTESHVITFVDRGDCTNACLDEKLLRQILSNLLSNAIKYSPGVSTVYFNLICKQQEAIFRVQDKGIGIPAADRDQLFDSFHRASNVGTISGTGLGLAIVKTSVNLHGGKVTVTSEVGVGTTFTVTIPLNNQV